MRIALMNATRSPIRTRSVAWITLGVVCTVGNTVTGSFERPGAGGKTIGAGGDPGSRSLRLLRPLGRLISPRASLTKRSAAGAIFS